MLSYCSCLLCTNTSWGTEPTAVSLVSPSHPVLTPRHGLLCLDALLTLPGGVYETNGTWEPRLFSILFFLSMGSSCLVSLSLFQMSADVLSNPAWAVAQAGHPTILRSSHAPKPVHHTFLHLNFIPRATSHGFFV